MTLKSQVCWAALLWHIATVFEDYPTNVRVTQHSGLWCWKSLLSRGGKASPSSQHICVRNFVLVCFRNAAKWDGSSGDLSLEPSGRSAWPAQSCAFGGRLPLCLVSPSEAIRISRHISCSEKSERERKRSFTKGIACQAQIPLCFCAENKHRCEG